MQLAALNARDCIKRKKQIIIMDAIDCDREREGKEGTLTVVSVSVS